MPHKKLALKKIHVIAAYGLKLPILNSLTDIGVRIIIDDFGRDYMSLSSLKIGNISKIKIRAEQFVKKKMKTLYEDFSKLKLKDMSKSISDMTYKYINPDTQAPTKVPASHYEGILDQIVASFIALNSSAGCSFRILIQY